jgi:hypothetical protein
MELIVFLAGTDKNLKKQLNAKFQAKEYTELTVLLAQNSNLLLSGPDFESSYTLIFALLNDHAGFEDLDVIVEPIVGDTNNDTIVKLRV